MYMVHPIHGLHPANVISCIYTNIRLQSYCSCNCFPKFLKFWTLLLVFILPRIIWNHELCFCFPSATNLDYFEVDCVHVFHKIAYVWNCFECGIWSLVLKISLWSVISFFLLRSLFVIFTTVLGVKQTFSTSQLK